MGTLGGFPNPPALWLRRAKPAFAYAVMGTLKGFRSALGTRHPPYTPLASRGLAKPSRALASAGEARLRLRDHGNPQRVPLCPRHGFAQQFGVDAMTGGIAGQRGELLGSG